MQKPVKPLVFITIFLFLTCQIPAQIRVFNNSSFSTDLKKIIEDYPNYFDHFRGDRISENPQSVDYDCKLKIDGAEESTITFYSAKKRMASWQAVMYSTDNFEKAKQKFKYFFAQLNNLEVSPSGSRIKLEGKYEAPDETKKFTSILLKQGAASGELSNLRVELLLQFNEPMEWKIKVLVYGIERKDDESGHKEEQ